MATASTPHPDCTATYCLPSTINDTGWPVMPELVGNCHRSFPVFASNAWNIRSFVPPVKTFFTVPNSYDLPTLGNATVAPAGIKVYTSGAIPGWRNSLLMTTMISGVVFRMPLTGDRRSPVGAPVAYFKTGNRYRDIAIAPDGLRLYVATDPTGQGRTVGPSGLLTRELVNPDAVLEFKYTGAGK